jgi:hypothetical protein
VPAVLALEEQPILPMLSTSAKITPSSDPIERSTPPEVQVGKGAAVAPTAPVTSRVARIAENWSLNQPNTPRDTPIFKTRDTPMTNAPFSRHALTGTTPSGITTGNIPPKVATKSINYASAATDIGETEDTPTTPMDVRSAVANWGKASIESSTEREKNSIRVVSSAKVEEEPVEEPTIVDVRNAVAAWGRSPAPTNLPSSSSLPQSSISEATPPPSQRDPVKAERRRSNLHEKYASIILPSLVEVETPNATPVGSIVARRDTSVNEVVSVDGQGQPDGEMEIVRSSESSHRRQPSAFQMHQALLDHKALVELVGTESSPLPPPASLPGSRTEPMVTLREFSTSLSRPQCHDRML